MNPSVEDLKLRAKLPDYSAGEGYVMVPFSDWTSALWLLGILERLEHLPETRAALAVPEPTPDNLENRARLRPSGQVATPAEKGTAPVSSCTRCGGRGGDCNLCGGSGVEAVPEPTEPHAACSACGYRDDARVTTCRACGGQMQPFGLAEPTEPPPEEQKEVRELLARLDAAKAELKAEAKAKWEARKGRQEAENKLALAEAVVEAARQLQSGMNDEVDSRAYVKAWEVAAVRKALEVFDGLARSGTDT